MRLSLKARDKAQVHRRARRERARAVYERRRLELIRWYRNQTRHGHPATFDLIKRFAIAREVGLKQRDAARTVGVKVLRP